MSHILTISRPKFNPEMYYEDNDYKFSMSCDGESCDLWAECWDRVHLVKEEYRWEDDIWEHGEEHRMLEGYCVRVPGCAYQENGLESDSVWDIARERGVGSYPVELAWYEWGSAEIYVKEE